MPDDLSDLSETDKAFFQMTQPEPEPKKEPELGAKIARWWGVGIFSLLATAVTVMIVMLVVKWLLWMYGMLF